MFAFPPVTVQVSTALTTAGNGAHDTEGGSATGEAATFIAPLVITRLPIPL